MAKRQLSSGSTKSAGSGGQSESRRWDEQVGLKPGEVLTVSEVEEGIDHVLKLAYEAAEGGLGEAWLFLGDLYLVSNSPLVSVPACDPSPR